VSKEEHWLPCEK